MKKSLLVLIATVVAISSCKKAEDKKDDNDNTNNNTVDPCTMVISSSEGPSAGDLFILGTDNTFNDSTLFKKTGTAQTWDFSVLVSSKEDTFNFQSTTGTSLGTLFPSANMIISAQGLDLAAIKSTAGISIIATELPPIINNISITPAFTDPAIFIPYPLQKDGSFSDTYSAGVTMPYDTVVFSVVHIDSIRATLTGSNSFSVDGCGKITTPTGTYDCVKYLLNPGTLVEKYEGHVVGSGWVDFTVMVKGLSGFKTPEFPLINSKSYVWVSKDKKFPVCMITVDASGNATSVQYLK